MRRHIDQCLPLEACGLLAGAGDLVNEVMPITNDAHSPVRFRMEPREQLDAFDRMQAAGQDLVGIFHSHPAGPDGPSPTDIAEAAYPVVYLVWSHRNRDWEARAFWIEQGRVWEVELHVVDGR